MHYITGTRFTVNTQLRPRQAQTGEKLAPGITYFILKIEKKGNLFLYTFVDTQLNKVLIQFNIIKHNFNKTTRYTYK